jgi:hypothetical protein
LAAATTSERVLEALSERKCRHNYSKARYFLKIFTEKFRDYQPAYTDCDNRDLSTSTGITKSKEPRIR